MAAAARAHEYQAIRIGSLAGDFPTTFDTYLKVGARYVLYCRKGDVFDDDRLLRLKQKSVSELFIFKADLPQYEMYIQRNVDASYNHPPGTPIEMRAGVILTYNCT